MINWNEPLPKHTKVDCYECYAKIVIEELYSNKFNNLKIVDKADLQSTDGEYGIEVTRAIDEDELKVERLYTYILYKRIRNIKKHERKLKDVVTS